MALEGLTNTENSTWDRALDGVSLVFSAVVVVGGIVDDAMDGARTAGKANTQAKAIGNIKNIEQKIEIPSKPYANKKLGNINRVSDSNIPGDILDIVEKAKKALKTKKHPFKEWFHRTFKSNQKIGNKERANPDIVDPYDLADAWTEWQELEMMKKRKNKFFK